MRRRVIRPGSCAGLLLAILFALASPVQAQDCADQTAPANGQAAFAKLALLEAGGCLGGEADRSTIATVVASVLRRKPVIAADAPIGSPYADAFDLLLAHTLGPHTAGDLALFSELARQLGATRDALGTFKTPAVATSWQITQGEVGVVAGSLQQRVDSACAKGGAPCTATFDSVREAMRIIGLARRTLNVEASPILRAQLDATTLRLKKWGHYFDTVRSQYVWELKINSWLMRDTRPQNAAGVSQGFRDVPSNQWMVLHPSVSFEFNKGAADGQKLEPAVVIDVIGYNVWKWRDDGGMGRAVGGSLIATIGDKASGHYVGWGGMLHINHTYSAGYTIRRGGEKAFLLTADVAKLWTKVPQPVRERIAGGK